MTSKHKAKLSYGTISEISKDIRLIFCSFVPVGLDDYVKYFNSSFDRFTYLKWKFPHGKGHITSSLTEYQVGKKIKEKRIFSLPAVQKKPLYFLMLPFNYLIYLWQCLVLLWGRDSKPVAVFIGVNYYCTFCGILLKKLGKVDIVIYRVMDFFPLPPKGIYRYLNRIFYMIDRFCLRNSDYIWFTTEGHIVGRERCGYFNRSDYEYLFVPLAMDPDKFVSKPIDNRNRFSLVYCGVISRYHLLDLLFQVISKLKKDYREIKLNVIGSGPDEAYFRQLATEMDLQDNIKFHGFMEEGEEFAELMADNILGIALYRDEENFMKYTEPAKVKYYLNFGVPAVVSRVPLIADELEAKEVCFAVNNQEEEIAKVIKDFIEDAKLQKEYKENVKELVKSLDINRLLDNAFFTTFGQVPKRYG